MHSDCVRRALWLEQFVDLALLDGHYLRRSDAEIFGEPAKAQAAARMSHAVGDLQIRPMTPPGPGSGHRDRAEFDGRAPLANSTYLAAWTREATPRRIALVAKDTETGVIVGFAVASLLPPQAELETIAVAAEDQRRGVARRLFTAMVQELRAAQRDRTPARSARLELPGARILPVVGFIETGRRPRYYADPVEDAVLLELRFRDPNLRLP